MTEFKNILLRISMFLCIIILSCCYGPNPPGSTGNPDLSVSIITPSGEFSPDTAFDLNIRVYNNGDTDSVESRLSIYLSSDSTLDISSDTLLADRVLPPIPALSSTEEIISQSLGSSGTWYIIAFADSGEVVTEQDEENNLNSTTIIINPAGTKDLQLSAIEIDTDNLNDGGSCNLTAVVSNQGTNTITETFSVSFYMSADSDFTPAGDTYLTEKEITHDFAEKSSMNLNTVLTLSDDTNLNQCVYFYAFLDNTDAVNEVDEVNNISSNNDAAVVLIFDDENGSRTYDLIIETYPPTGTVDTNPDTWLGLYSSTGTEINTNDTGGTFSGDGYSEVAYTVPSPGSTFYVVMWGNNEGPYALSVRTGNIELKYFTNEISVDPYEPDDSHSSNVPDTPVPVTIGGFLNRYSADSDWDWFVIELP